MVVSIITLAIIVYLGALLVRTLRRRAWSSRKVRLAVGGISVAVVAGLGVLWIPASHGGSSGGTSHVQRIGPP